MRNCFLALLLMGSAAVSSVAQAGPVKGIDGRTVDVPTPKRVVVLNSSLVEIVFGLGQGQTVVGTDVTATYPPETANIAKVGHPYQPSVEGIISLSPDLVIGAEENLTSTSAEQLRGAKLPVLILENSSKEGISGLLRRIEVLARVFNAEEAGQRMKQDITRQVAELEKKIALAKKKPRVLFLYAHSPGEAFVYGKETGTHALIELAGGQNAADFTTGTKALTAEGMVQASPDAIIMLHRGLEAVSGVHGALNLPGVAVTPAGKNKKILAVDNSVRWIGPRFPAFAEKLFSEIHAAPSR
ncbi:heme/hemin ABC transporter substrate-binding protein [Stigmatella aurantiaca]|nr:ABC transporter substrate-binding protein [Stigmatella aurantiaca]ADO71376.1 ABC-type hemin transport system, periplasmic component [Stigmatella aurantiaca DW4/3-1]